MCAAVAFPLVAIVYSSKRGHVQAIASRLAAAAQVHGVKSIMVDVRSAGELLKECDAAVLAGSVHFDRHDRKLFRLVKQNLSRLSSIPTAFVSVSGSAASEDTRPKAEEYLAQFLRQTGWKPDRTLTVAGAVLFTRYNFLLRLIMKRISARAGRTVDTSRDYVYTDWDALDAFMHNFLDTVERYERVHGDSPVPLPIFTS